MLGKLSMLLKFVHQHLMQLLEAFEETLCVKTVYLITHDQSKSPQILVYLLMPNCVCRLCDWISSLDTASILV